MCVFIAVRGVFSKRCISVRGVSTVRPVSYIYTIERSNITCSRHLAEQVAYTFTALVTIAALVSLVLRFIRAKERERQQIKWLTYGTALMAMLIISSIFVLNDPNIPIYVLIFDLAIMLLPLSIGISILRNQLYDIDRLFNRTLVYGSLSVLLALIYFGCVVLLQNLVNGLTGQVGQSPILIVGSTLAIAALFQPLRRRIQRIIDRRFYRRKYDTAHTLAAFSATLRNEVDLSELSEHLMAVVQETMQPTQVALWLRQPTRRATPSLQTSKALTEETRILEQSAGHGE
jgi:asparagine N-glycosylation enzyme membrane subunit Stt3